MFSISSGLAGLDDGLWLKHIRVRFSIPESQEEATSERSVSASLKGDKKASWFPRLASARMADTEFSPDGSFEAAVAATAYAINSQQDQEMVQVVRKLPSKKTMSPKDEERRRKMSNVGKISRYFSIKDDPKDGDEDPKESPAKTTKAPSAVKRPVPERKPSLERTLTFPGPGSKKSEPEPKIQPSVKPPVARPNDSSGVRRRNQNSTSKPKINGIMSKTMAWENAQREKIKKRYNKSTATVLEWENAKKTKAKKNLEKKERKLELKRSIALQQYREDIQRIDMISSGARAEAEGRRRNEEAKLREEVKEMQLTGKTPRTFLCF